MQRYGCQDFVEEIAHLQKLAEMLPDSPVTESMANTFMAKIQGFQSWSSESICQMLAKADEASKLPEAMKAKILDTIQNLSMNTGSQLKLVNTGQSVQRLCPYLTRPDWVALSTLTSQTDQLELLAKRLRAMGLHSLKECTKGQAVAIVLMVQASQGKPSLSAAAINSAVQDFGIIFQSLPSSNCPGASRYPDHPSEMGQLWLSKAYGPGDQPDLQDPCLAPFLKKVPLRSTHASLAGGTRCRSKRPPATPQGSTLSFDQELEMLKLRHGIQAQAATQGTATLQGSQGPTAAATAVLPWLSPRSMVQSHSQSAASTTAPGQVFGQSTASAAALPLPPASPPPEATTRVEAAPTETTAKEDSAKQDAKTLQEYEQEQFQKLLDAKADKKKKAKEDGQADQKPKKQHMKRPAAAMSTRQSSANQGTTCNGHEAGKGATAAKGGSTKILYGCHSQSALAAFVEVAKEQGLPEKSSSNDQRKAREELLQSCHGGLLGPLIQEAEVTTDDGAKVTMYFANLLVYLASLFQMGGSFHDLIQRKHRANPSSVSKPWQLILYADEVIPGNVLGPAQRKFWAIYASFREMDQFLHHEDLWLTISLERSNFVSHVQGGICQIMSKILETIFANVPMSGSISGGPYVWQTAVPISRFGLPKVTKAEFSQWQQATGWTWNPQALLLNQTLLAKNQVKPVSQFCHDWMHGILQGTAPVVLFQSFQAISEHYNIWEAMGPYIRMWNFPGASKAGHLAGLFDTSKVAKYKSSQKFSCQASDLLGLYPIIRHFLHSVVVSSGICPEACQAFLSQACLIDQVHQGVMYGATTRASLLRAAEESIETFQQANFDVPLMRKWHWLLHLPDILQRHGCLPSTFTSERKHKTISAFATRLQKTAAFEIHLLNQVLATEITTLTQAGLFPDSCQLVKPKKPNKHQLQFLNQFVDCSATEAMVASIARLARGGAIHANDVVVFHQEDGRWDMGQVLFHLELGGDKATLVQRWRPTETQKTKQFAKCSITNEQ
ncbi:unnamed protein product, partial [Symbiodinium sp. CCMP2592]